MRRLLDDTDIRHEIGDDEAGVMSQKATTEAISESVKELPRSIEQISAVEKRVSNLELAIIPSPFENDDTVAYGKAVPANALPYAEVNSIGGMCAIKDGAMFTAPVTEVKSIGANFVDMERFYDANNWVAAAGDKRSRLSLGVLPVGTYVISGFFNSTIGGYLYLRAREADGTYTKVAYLYQGGEQSLSRRILTLTQPLECELWIWWGSHPSLAECLNLYSDIQVKRGTTDTEYEPYKSASLPIPAAIRNLNGYGLGAGEVSNTVGFDTGKYTRRVGIVDLGSVAWYYGNWGAKNVFSTYSFQAGGERETIKAGTKNVVCSASFVGVGEIYNGTADNAFCVNGDSIRGMFSGYTDVASFKAAMSGVMLVYELAEPEVIDISDKLSADNYIKVFENGTVFMESENKLDVPSTITYQIKEVSNES